MRVLALVHDAFGGIGGIAQFNRELITALADWPRCTEVVVLPRFQPLEAEPLPQKVVFDRAALGGVWRYALRCLGRRFADGRFDLVICGHVRLMPFAWLWRTGRARIGLILHGIEAWSPPDGRAARRLAGRADFHIAVSRITRERFAGWAGCDADDIEVLPNCVDLARFAPGPKDPALLARYGLAGRRVVMTLGRMVASERAKGFDEMLRALPALAREVPAIAWLVIGDGDDLARLKDEARRLGLEDRVVFAGYVAEADKPDHYRLADAYAMPSRGEGFGIVFLEAMASGLPVVASCTDGGAEALLDGRLGALVDPDDADALAAAIRSALERGPGAPPAELEGFSRTAFIRRVHHIMDRVADAGG